MNGIFANYETDDEEAGRAQAPGRGRRGFEDETSREERDRRQAAIDAGFRQRCRRAPRQVHPHREDDHRNPVRSNEENAYRYEGCEGGEDGSTCFREA
jgi:hypothetical protein